MLTETMQTFTMCVCVYVTLLQIKPSVRFIFYCENDLHPKTSVGKIVWTDKDYKKSDIKVETVLATLAGRIDCESRKNGRSEMMVLEGFKRDFLKYL